MSQSYDDWTWVQSFAAVGDSFTAGIGAGRLYSDDSSSRDCSRYDSSYPVVMQRFMGNVKNFQYPACSGDTSVSILNQIDQLNGGIDLAVMTAGGNDLCLSNIILQCVLSRFSSESDCQNAIDQANNAINGYLQQNVLALLQELDHKMNRGGVIVLALYAQYFDWTTDSCQTENWGWPLGGLPLTADRRVTFNTLVRNTNAALKNAANAGGWTNAQVVVADWDFWTYYMKGEFCEPGQNPNPDDASNTNLVFFKLDTSPVNLGDIPVGPLKIRGNISDIYSDDIPGNIDMEAEAVELAYLAARNAAELVPYPLLRTRGITQPTCPSGILKNVIGYLLPDSIGKIFHPTVLGHQVIASFALDVVRGARAKQLGIAGPGCVSNTLECFSDHDTGHYISSYAAYSSTADFCDSVASGAPSGVANWQYTKTYYSGTLDEVDFSLALSGGASSFDHNQCISAVNGILDGCDKFSSNPMNWKQGGTYTVGSYKYTIQPKRQNKLWPYPTEPKQSCEGWYKLVLDSYDIYGAGWATWDWGQQSLRPNSTSCFGLGITNWHFEYFDQPDSNGYEWHAWFNSPIWTRSRCFNNNKVQNSAGGGSSGGCKGNG